MSYTESKSKINSISEKYSCAMSVILRSAIQYVVEFGQHNFKDEVWFDELMNDIDERHNIAEANGKILFVTRDFEKAIFECAKELAQIEPYDFLTYIQREIYLGGDGISYQRAIELLTKCIETIYENHNEDCFYTLEELRCNGFRDSELEELGCGYLLDVMEDDE